MEGANYKCFNDFNSSNTANWLYANCIILPQWRNGSPRFSLYLKKLVLFESLR